MKQTDVRNEAVRLIRPAFTGLLIFLKMAESKRDEQLFVFLDDHLKRFITGQPASNSTSSLAYSTDNIAFKEYDAGNYDKCLEMLLESPETVQKIWGILSCEILLRKDISGSVAKLNNMIPNSDVYSRLVLLNYCLSFCSITGMYMSFDFIY